MSTIVTTIIDELIGRPSATKGMLWSLGLHATVFAATYTAWSSPIAPVSFAGHREAVQIEATFSDLRIDQEIETAVELEATLDFSQMLEDEIDSAVPPIDSPPVELPRMKPEIVIADAVDTAIETTIETEPPHGPSSTQEPREIKPVESEKYREPQPIEPPSPETVPAVEQFAGVEDRAPADLSGNRPPAYPAEAVRRRLAGVVLLRVRIAASGRVERVEIAKTSGHAILDRTAIAAVSTWRGHPAEQEGRPVATVELLPVRFRL